MDIPAKLPGNFAALQDWNDVRYAIVVARCGSIAGAARQLGVDQTTVARRLHALESSLGTALFERHRGKLTPTAAGEVLRTRGQRLEAEMAALFHLGADQDTLLQGTVRITAVDALTAHYLANQLADLRQQFPHLSIEIISSSTSLDLMRREADIALRLARPAEGDLVTRRVSTLAYRIYGPPTPDGVATAADWCAAHWVAYEHSLGSVPEMRWLADQVAPERIVFRCNNIDALAHAVAEGVGFGILPSLIARRHAGLQCYSGQEAILSRDIWLVLPRELRDIPRIRAVCDWLVARFERDRHCFD